MRIVNQSRLPDDEVARLVRFAFRGVRDAGIVVKVKNRTRGAYHGRAYQTAPSMSSVRGMLVTIGIGPESAYPTNNMVTATRMVRKVEVHGIDLRQGLNGKNPYHEACKQADGLLAAGEQFIGVDYSGNNCCAQVRVAVIEQHPYGGQSSPLIEYADWREALVGVAAHESRHIHQFQARARGKRTPLSEVDCERYASKRLEAWRNR